MKKYDLIFDIIEKYINVSSKVLNSLHQRTSKVD